MPKEYPLIEGVEVLLERKPLARDRWEEFDVKVCDLQDALSGTVTTHFHKKGTIRIQAVDPQKRFTPRDAT